MKKIKNISPILSGIQLVIMQEYLQKNFDWRSKSLSNSYDELPFWSAASGNLLLENLPYGEGKTILDIGCGTGFPLLNIARRFGPSCEFIGVDTWDAGLHRAAEKIDAWKLKNVKLLHNDARQIDLPTASIDLITSNLGINNFDDLPSVLNECKRLLRPNGRLCIATNLLGTFQEFYNVFLEYADSEIHRKVVQHIHHRPSVASITELFLQNGFGMEKVVEAVSTMTYANGTAFLNDNFIVMAFLPDWKALVPQENWYEVFRWIESRLNALAKVAGYLRLTIPISYFEFKRLDHLPTPPGSWISQRPIWNR